MSSENEKKLTFKERLGVLKRTVNILNEADPGCLFRALVRELPDIISGYAGIYFAGLIIDGVVSAKPVSYIITAALIVYGIEFFSRLIKQIICSKRNCHDFTLRENLNKLLWHKTLTLDYTKAEETETLNKYRTAQNYLDRSGGIAYQLEHITYMTYGFFNLAAGLILICPIALGKPATQGGFIGFVQSGWGFAAVIAAMIIVIIINSAVLTPIGLKCFHKFNTDPKLHEMQRVGGDIVWDCFRNYRTGKEIRLYSEQDIMVSKFSYFQSEFIKGWGKVLKKTTGTIIAQDSLNALLTVMIYGFAIIRAASGMISPGEVVAFAMYFARVQAGFEAVSGNFSNLMEKTEYCRMVYDYLDIPDEKYQGTIPTEKRDDNEYEFEFRHVYFKYPNTENYVLRDINLKWRIGEKMALVGRNGSGKSTLVKLLCRLYDPTEGEILLNGIDIRKYSTQEYTDLFSVVFQDSGLLSFSIGENVAVDTEYDRKYAEECVRRAGFSERLDSCPDGLDTCLYKDFDEKGVEISGGEAQKLCLARAVYKGAPFIVLDEPTAALDPVSEYDIYTKFNDIVGTRTAVYISHRLSSCRFCDNITVLDSGEIAERGSHEVLLEQGGVYAKMWAAQAEYYKDTAGELFD